MMNVSMRYGGAVVAVIACCAVTITDVNALQAITQQQSWQQRQQQWSVHQPADKDEINLSRRHMLLSFLTRGTGWIISSSSVVLFSDPIHSLGWATDVDVTSTLYPFETRDRHGNRDALIRDDYWYMMGKLPPRQLQGPLRGDDPAYNAFGSCESTVSGGGNPCTYVSLRQRIPAYSKYGFAIRDGAKEYAKLGSLLHQLSSIVEESNTSNNDALFLWQQAATYVKTQERGTPPPPVVDAELKMVLLATALLTSPNFPIPSRELLVARYYANEAHYAASAIATAIAARDRNIAVAAWEYGRDAWNSYFQVVNRAIVPKVGDQFVAIG